MSIPYREETVYLATENSTRAQMPVSCNTPDLRLGDWSLFAVLVSSFGLSQGFGWALWGLGFCG